MEKKLNFLKNVFLFQGIEEKYIKELLKDMTEKNYEKGIDIIKEGEKGSDLFFLFSGEVLISKRMTLFEEIAGINHVDKSLIKLKDTDFAFFGEMALCGGKDIRSATVTTESKCILSELKADSILKLINEHDELAHFFFKNLSNVLADRLRAANRNILKLTTALTLALEE